MTTTGKNSPHRLGLYRKIEVARKQLPDMDEEAFRALLRAEFGKESRKDMTMGQLERLVGVFADMGVTFTKAGKKRPHCRSDFYEITDSMPFARERRKICAIWKKLGYDMTALDTRCQRAFNVPSFAWLKDGDQVRTLLNDLERREAAFDKRGVTP